MINVDVNNTMGKSNPKRMINSLDDYIASLDIDNEVIF